MNRQAAFAVAGVTVAAAATAGTAIGELGIGREDGQLLTMRVPGS